MVQARVVRQVKEGMYGSGFGVRAAVHQAIQTAVHDGAGTHGTGLGSDVEGAAGESPAVEVAAGFFNGQQFGVRRGAGKGFPQIVSAGNDRIFMDNDGADGNFFYGKGGFGFRQRFSHI